MSRLEKARAELAAAEAEDANQPAEELEQANLNLERIGEPGQSTVNDTVPLVAWQIRGVIGGLNLLLRMQAAGHEIPSNWRKVLRDVAEKILDSIPPE